MESLTNLVSFLNRELKPECFQDASHNGLQVQNTGRIKRICCGVDASMAFFEAAQARKADLLICHHGISWGDSLAHITDLNYHRLKFLLSHNIALYASHLPLDAHAVYGNNACIAKALGLRALKPFGNYHGQHIGTVGRLPKAIPYADFKAQVATTIGGAAPLQSMDFGKHQVRTVAVVSGGAADMVTEAGQQGVDVYITGEPVLAAYCVAQEYRLNAIFAGHYATEVFGVQALGDMLQKNFAVETEFIDMAVPY